MTSNRPYLIRAYYEWIVDNNLTPHLVVDATQPGVVVPMEHVKDGQIVLNISPTACGNLQLGSVDIEFDARFSGVPRHILIPCTTVLAIYARENGAGTMFPKETHEHEESIEDESDDTATPLTSIDGGDIPDDISPSPDDEPPKPGKKGKPNLKIVK
ncbi:MAG: ClpXP protease specificity-enhancing factor [Aestuariibacter sp.]